TVEPAKTESLKPVKEEPIKKEKPLGKVDSEKNENFAKKDGVDKNTKQVLKKETSDISNGSSSPSNSDFISELKEPAQNDGFLPIDRYKKVKYKY
ncbi:MAG: hypothetical protein WCJ33_09145, partial [Pseudomonadota bacterium]